MYPNLLRSVAVAAKGGLAGLALLASASALAQETPPRVESAAGPPFAATYADVADLADAAPLVIRAQIRKLARVEDARASGLRPGRGRFYIEARTVSLITGTAALGQQLAFLADLPLDARGKPPRLKKQDVVLFARAATASAGSAPGAAALTLVAPDAMLLSSPETDARVRAIVTAMVAPDAPVKVTGVREIINVPGNLADESDTQIFLTTRDGSAASLMVAHRAGSPPRWGASFSELTAEIGNPPRPDTLEWYRLACFLPQQLSPSANLSETPAARAQAESDYRMVLGELGPCRRSRR